MQNITKKTGSVGCWLSFYAQKWYTAIMKRTPQIRKESGYTIGRDAFAKISAVEGIYLNKKMQKDFQAFEQKGLSHQARREAISRKYAH